MLRLSRCRAQAMQGGCGLDEADGEASQAGGVLGTEAGAATASVLVPVHVEDVVAGVLDGPVAAAEGE